MLSLWTLVVKLVDVGCEAPRADICNISDSNLIDDRSFNLKELHVLLNVLDKLGVLAHILMISN